VFNNPFIGVTPPTTASQVKDFIIKQKSLPDSMFHDTQFRGNKTCQVSLIRWFIPLLLTDIHSSHCYQAVGDKLNALVYMNRLNRAITPGGKLIRGTF